MAKNILIIEDDEFFRELISKELVSKGFGILEAVDGQKGIEKAKESKPDLILLDLRLPLIDGHEVLKTVKESYGLRAIPVVILTSSENKGDIVRAYSNYANSYLVKPLSSDTLVKMIISLGEYWLKWNRNPV